MPQNKRKNLQWLSSLLKENVTGVIKGHVAKTCKVKRSVELKCFKCKKSGHIAKNCRDDKPSCSICKKTNHMDKECYFQRKKETTKENKKVSFLLGVKPSDSSSWILDSGSTSHMVNDVSLLKNKKEVNSEITLAKKGKTMKASSVGRVNLGNCNLENVLSVPDLMKNLLSVSAITSKGGEVTFKGKEVTIKKGDTTYTQGYRNSVGLYEVEIKEKDHALCAEKANTMKQWHRRLGHIENSQLKKLLTMSCGINLEEKNVEDNRLCDVCVRAKQPRRPFAKERRRATRALLKTTRSNSFNRHNAPRIIIISSSREC